MYFTRLLLADRRFWFRADIIFSLKIVG